MNIPTAMVLIFMSINFIRFIKIIKKSYQFNINTRVIGHILNVLIEHEFDNYQFLLLSILIMNQEFDNYFKSYALLSDNNKTIKKKQLLLGVLNGYFNMYQTEEKFILTHTYLKFNILKIRVLYYNLNNFFLNLLMNIVIIN